MKFSESWLREWVNPNLSTKALCDRLTMAGLEVEMCFAASEFFSDVVVGEVKQLEKHPQADRLNVCQVDVGDPDLLQIVCGAANVRVGLRAPVAKVGAVLPGIKIKAAKLRGVESQGMLCSPSELSLAEESQGLMVLPDDAPLGEDFRRYYGLDDHVIEVAITPNRGDCLSIQGIAREVSALTKSSLTQVDIPSNTVNPAVPAPVVKVAARSACPHYLARRIEGVNPDAVTPVWMKERLRRSGIRSINAVVDVTNYVMLELGQPMHAFDADKLSGGVSVRFAKAGETIALLDGSEKTLTETNLIIADDASPLALAGVMGGVSSSVTLITKNILLESAYFLPTTVAKQRQQHQLNSDSAYRFERGVDATLQRLAIERASALITAIAGGQLGAVTTVTNEAELPATKSIFLPELLLEKILGFRLAKETVIEVFKVLNFPAVYRDDGWTVNVPVYRSDITLPEDLVEEVARIHGYDAIPMATLPLSPPSAKAKDPGLFLNALRSRLADAGLHEVITYSFVDAALQATLNPDVKAEALENPMTADMSVMRTSLWPNLITTLQYNAARQQPRSRLFEMGTVFLRTDDALLQPTRAAGLITGDAYPLQWGEKARPADFFDLKGVLTPCFETLRPTEILTFKPEVHPALHPGQSAGLYVGEVKVGQMGLLHPELKRSLDLDTDVYLFELFLDRIPKKKTVISQPVSKFPEIRRDLALLVQETIPVDAIQDTIKGVAGDWLKTCFVFDVYQGKGVASNFKSIAVALYIQHPTRTLVDDDITALLARVIAALKDQLGVELRS